MSAARAIQNFRGFRGVWWGPAGHNADALAAALSRLGLTLIAFSGIGAEELNPERDVLFVDADGQFDPARAAQSGRFLSLVPVVGIVGVEAPSRLKALSDIGATALLHKPIHPATVYSSLFLAVNNHARVARLEAEIADHNRRRSERRYVVRAIILIMQQTGATDEKAYAHLRRESMARRVGVEAFARDLCERAGAHQDLALSPKQENHYASQDEASGDRRPWGSLGAEPGPEPGRRPDQARRTRGPIR